MAKKKKGEGALLKKQRRSILPRRKDKGGSTKAPETMSGSNTAVQAKAAKLGPILALCVLIFLVIGSGAGLAGMFRSPEVQVAPQEGTAGPSQEQQRAETYASGLVGAWLGATRDNRAVLDDYGPVASETEVQAEKPVEYRDLAPVSSTANDDGTITVLVTASVKTTEGEGDDEIVMWRPQTFQVALAAEDDGRMSVLAMPTPVQNASAGGESELAYEYDVRSDEIETTVSDFLKAYATEDGDVTRYVSPDSDITSISNTPFTGVEVLSMVSREEIEEGDPSDGDKTSVLVTAEMQTSAGKREAQYALTLTGRGGRWEVEKIDPAPQLAEEE